MAFGLHDKIDNKFVSIKGERYVYYKRLETDGYSALYQKAYVDTLLPRVADGSNAHNIAEYFASLRDAEYKKEIALLSTKFGTNITEVYNTDNTKAGEQLIHAFNKIYNTKEIFNYHLSLIQDTKGQKGVITYFPTYLGKLWEDNRAILIDQINNVFKEHLLDCDTYILKTLRDFMQDLVYKTLIYMYEDTENQNGVKNNPWIVQRPYKELAQELKKLQSNSDIFIDSMIKIYGLDKFVDNLGEIIIQSKNATTSLNKITKNNKQFDLSFSKGGFAKEVESWFIAAINGLVGKRTGGYGGKPDITYTVEVPEDIVEKAYEAIPLFKNRGLYTLAAEKIKEQLKQFDDGFLIYTTQKDYTLNDNFKGFSADTDISLQTWDNMMFIMSLKSSNLIFSVLQTIPGAIGDQDQDHVADMFARAIAGALFDDFDVKGQVAKTGAKTIHLLNLNGIYIPMSFYYDKLYQAFEYASINQRSLVRVTINTPESIQFPYVYPFEGGSIENNEALWREANPDDSPWRYQSEIALQQTLISFHFFQGFKKIMQDIGYILE